MRELIERGVGVIVRRRERAEMEGEVDAQFPTDLVARGAAMMVPNIRMGICRCKGESCTSGRCRRATRVVVITVLLRVGAVGAVVLVKVDSWQIVETLF